MTIAGIRQINPRKISAITMPQNSIMHLDFDDKENARGWKLPSKYREPSGTCCRPPPAGNKVPLGSRNLLAKAATPGVQLARRREFWISGLMQMAGRRRIGIRQVRPPSQLAEVA